MRDDQEQCCFVLYWFFDFEIVWLDIDIVWGVDVVGNEILLVLGG